MSDNDNKSLGGYWIKFFISLALTIAFLIFKPEFFWVVLPFLFTYFVQAMDWLDPDTAN